MARVCHPVTMFRSSLLSETSCFSVRLLKIWHFVNSSGKATPSSTFKRDKDNIKQTNEQTKVKIGQKSPEDCHGNLRAHICLCDLCDRQPLTCDNPVIPRGGGIWAGGFSFLFEGKEKEMWGLDWDLGRPVIGMARHWVRYSFQISGSPLSSTLKSGPFWLRATLLGVVISLLPLGMLHRCHHSPHSTLSLGWEGVGSMGAKGRSDRNAAGWRQGLAWELQLMRKVWQDQS